MTQAAQMWGSSLQQNRAPTNFSGQPRGDPSIFLSLANPEHLDQHGGVASHTALRSQPVPLTLAGRDDMSHPTQTPGRSVLGASLPVSVPRSVSC